MVRRYIYAATICFALTIFSFSYLDNTYDLSFKLFYWDSIEHFLGGMTIGFSILTLLEMFKIRYHRAALILLGVLGAGLAWEALEYFAGFGAGPFLSYKVDTLKDLVVDCMGGYAAIKLGHRMHVRYL